MGFKSLRQRLDDDTAQDRLILVSIVGADQLIRQLSSSAIDDIRGGPRRFERTLTAEVGFGPNSPAELLDTLRPLIFATAWKVSDLLVEAEMELTTGKAPPPRGWRITEKVKFVRRGVRPNLEPFASYPALWKRTEKLYARLEESRNAVIHRRFKRSADGALVPYGVKGRPLRAISVEEIDAFAVASYGVAEEVVAGVPDRRRCAAIAMRLDGLRGLTRVAPIAGSMPTELRIVRVNLTRKGRRWELDLDRIRAHLASQSPAFADIEAFAVGTDRVYGGRLEDAPDNAKIDFPATNPPAWLTAHTTSPQES